MSEHKTRFSDASTFDSICTVCGATDAYGGGLNEPCPGPRATSEWPALASGPERARKEVETLKEENERLKRNNDYLQNRNKKLEDALKNVSGYLDTMHRAKVVIDDALGWS